MQFSHWAALFCFNSEINVCVHTCVHTYIHTNTNINFWYIILFGYLALTSTSWIPTGTFTKITSPRCPCTPQPHKKIHSVSHPLPFACALANDLRGKAVMGVRLYTLYFSSVWSHGLKSVVFKWCNLEHLSATSSSVGSTMQIVKYAYVIFIEFVITDFRALNYCIQKYSSCAVNSSILTWEWIS